ncbi:MULTISPECIES: hypothetical protein [unclassified Nostoc]|uniref:hypothetical protein n=1 Tax=unclassified Nostoc TaxID=2593658 RepID=UPI001F54A17C|nr:MULTISPECIES: hypothetical protein [unclassified Nostoc]
MGYSKKTLLLAGLLTSNLILITPAIANASIAPNQPNKTFLEQFLETYNSLQESIDKYRQNFSISWSNIIKDVDGLIKSTNGDLETPDPTSAGERIRKAIEKNKQQDATVVPTLDSSPEIDGRNAERDFHQQYTLGQSQSVLGISGQRIQRQEAEISNDAVASSSDLADTAQQDVVTQDILKKIAAQNLQATIINKSLHSEAQKQTRALATANINLADISSRMDEQAQEEERQTRAAVRSAVLSSAAIDAFWENQ